MTETPTAISPGRTTAGPSRHLAAPTWRSKLGTVYDLGAILKLEKQHQKEIYRLRDLPENKVCADCGSSGTVWASVNLGVFLCFRCCSIHRSIGTHISLPKGCTGSDLWGPDEIERMKALGNHRAKLLYGGDTQRPPMNASVNEWRQYILQKYEQLRFAPPGKHSVCIFKSAEQLPDQQVVPLSPTRIAFPALQRHRGMMAPSSPANSLTSLPRAAAAPNHQHDKFLSLPPTGMADKNKTRVVPKLKFEHHYALCPKNTAAMQLLAKPCTGNNVSSFTHAVQVPMARNFQSAEDFFDSFEQENKMDGPVAKLDPFQPNRHCSSGFDDEAFFSEFGV